MKISIMQVGPIGTNCYILEDEKKIAVIDPGDEAERSGLRLEKILLTHGHYDHVKEVDALADVVPDPGVAIYLHRGDVRGDDARLFPPLAHGFNCWEDGDIISIGSPESGVNLHVLHTPGHSAGSVTLLAEGVSAVYTDELTPGDLAEEPETGAENQASAEEGEKDHGADGKDTIQREDL